MADGGGGGDGFRKSNEFVICEGCNENVAVALLSTHNCSNVRLNLGSRVVETQTESKKKKLKRPPPTAFYVFMKEFRKTYQKANQYVNLKDVPKLGGEKWKSFTEDEKKVYRDKAVQLMEEYNKETDDAEETKAEVEKKEYAPYGGQRGRGRGRGILRGSAFG